MDPSARMSSMPAVLTSRPSNAASLATPLLHAASTGASMLQRRTSLSLQGGSPTAAGNKHADVYLTELLSYSLDRLRKVRARPWGPAAAQAALHGKRTALQAAMARLPRQRRTICGAPTLLPTPTFPTRFLNQEPELLAEERHQLERALQASALSHYRALIDGAGCLQAVRDALEEALLRLEALQEVGVFSRGAGSVLSWEPLAPAHAFCACDRASLPGARAASRISGRGCGACWPRGGGAPRLAQAARRAHSIATRPRRPPADLHPRSGGRKTRHNVVFRRTPPSWVAPARRSQRTPRACWRSARPTSSCWVRRCPRAFAVGVKAGNSV